MKFILTEWLALALLYYTVAWIFGEGIVTHIVALFIVVYAIPFLFGCTVMALGFLREWLFPVE